MAEKLVTFRDIEIPEMSSMDRPERVRSITKLEEFQIGRGSRVFRADSRGLWLGAAKYEDAPFKVDMDGNVTGITFDAAEVTGLIVNSGVLNSSEINGGEINGATITGGLFRTAATGVRIEIDSENDQNEIRFYDSTTLYATLRVRTDAGDGYVEIKDPDGAGIEFLSGVGASGFGVTNLISIGGIISTGGNASNSFNGLIGRGGTVKWYVGNESAGSDYVYATGLPTSNPGGTGRVWNDGGTLKIT